MKLCYFSAYKCTNQQICAFETVEVNCEVNECIFFMHMLPWSAWKLICWCEKWGTSWVRQLWRSARHHNSFNFNSKKDATTRAVSVPHSFQMNTKGMKYLTNEMIPEKATTNKPTKNHSNRVSVLIMSQGCPGTLWSHSDADGTQWTLHFFINCQPLLNSRFSEISQQSYGKAVAQQC